MAVTWALTNLTRDFTAKRITRGTLTATGTYTAGGDSVTAATLGGLHTIQAMSITPSSTTTPTKFDAQAVIQSGNQSVKIQLFGVNAIPGPAVIDPELTAGTTITGETLQFEAIGT